MRRERDAAMGRECYVRKRRHDEVQCSLGLETQSRTNFEDFLGKLHPDPKRTKRVKANIQQTDQLRHTSSLFLRPFTSAFQSPVYFLSSESNRNVVC